MRSVKSLRLSAGAALSVLTLSAPALSQEPPQPPPATPQEPRIPKSVRSDVPIIPVVTAEEEMAREQAARLSSQGKALYKNGKLADAAKALEQSLALAPLSNTTRLALADVYTDMGELQKAVQTYQVAVFDEDDDGKVTLATGEPVTLFKFALVLSRAGDLPSALKMYHYGTEHLFPKNSSKIGWVDLPRFDTPYDPNPSALYSPRRLEAMIRVGLGMVNGWGELPYRKRVAELDKAVELWPGAATAHFYRAKVMLQYPGVSANETYENRAKIKADLQQAIALDKQTGAVASSFLKSL